MDFVRLGSTGLKVSRLCLGCMTYGLPEWREWVLDEAASRPLIRKALDLGINFFDTADMYSLGGSEEILGRALRDFAARDDVVIATKVFHPMSDKPNAQGLSRKHILASTPRSGVYVPTMSISISFIDSTRRHRSRKPSKPWTSSCARVRPATSAHLPCTPGSSCGCSPSRSSMA